MIRCALIDPDHRTPPTAIEIASADDLYQRLGGREVRTTFVRRLPDGYDLVALSSTTSTRKNVTVRGEQLTGPVILAVYDDMSAAYVHPNFTVERAILAEARILVSISEAIACPT